MDVFPLGARTKISNTLDSPLVVLRRVSDPFAGFETAITCGRH